MKKKQKKNYPLELVLQNIVDFLRVCSLLGIIVHLSFFFTPFSNRFAFTIKNFYDQRILIKFIYHRG